MSSISRVRWMRKAISGLSGGDACRRIASMALSSKFMTMVESSVSSMGVSSRAQSWRSKRMPLWRICSSLTVSAEFSEMQPVEKTEKMRASISYSRSA